MNREIKFRAFVDGEMRQIELWIACCDGNKIKPGYVTVAWQSGDNAQTFKDIPQEDLRQYIGYKGIGDVEIYAGDIVRHINHERLLWIGINEVKQDKWGRWLPFGPHRKVTEELDQLTILVPHEFEVIGNVRENPELLE